MKLNFPPPKAKLFLLFPMWMGNDWRWLEFVDVKLGMTFGMPMVTLSVRT